jgi:hypothetical protein
MNIDRPSAEIYYFPMASGIASATEEAGSIPIAADEAAAAGTKEAARGFLQAARRNLSEEDLATPAARRFLIAEIERLDERCIELATFEKSYNDQRVEIAILTEGARKSRWIEILGFVCSSIGAAGIGAAPSYLSLPGGVVVGVMMLIFAAILFLVGLLPRIVR